MAALHAPFLLLRSARWVYYFTYLLLFLITFLTNCRILSVIKAAQQMQMTSVTYTKTVKADLVEADCLYLQSDIYLTYFKYFKSVIHTVNQFMPHIVIQTYSFLGVTLQILHSHSSGLLEVHVY